MATNDPTPEEQEAAKLAARAEDDNRKRIEAQDRTARKAWEKEVAAEEAAIAKAEAKAKKG